MNSLKWYITFQELIREFRQGCGTAMREYDFVSEDRRPNLDKVLATRDMLISQVDKLVSHWKVLISNEPFPRLGDIQRHLKFAELNDFRNLVTNDFIEAESRANLLLEETLKMPRQDFYIDPARIHSLLSLTQTTYDLRRLIALCNELNTAYQSELLIAIPLLVRSLLDHIPPIFNCKSFKEVSSNYSGTRSFKDSAQHLEESSRKIGDGLLHTHIRRAESLPTFVQIDFRQSLDVVLGEIERVLR